MVVLALETEALASATAELELETVASVGLVALVALVAMALQMPKLDKILCIDYLAN